MTPSQGKPAIDEAALLRAAHEAAKHAYAPYSRFTVGAAILLDDGRVFSGCNVENVSYGLTNCAERTAIFSAVAASTAKPHLRAVAVVNGSGNPCSPCGACRQVMAEFATAETVVIYKYHDPNAPKASASGAGDDTSGRMTQSVTRRMLMRELLPDGFEF